MKIKAIIFDFDGTIADSFDAFIKVVKDTARSRIADDSAQINELRKLSLPQIIKKLGIKQWQIPLFIAKGRRQMAKQMHTVEPFDGIKEAFDKLAQQGYSLYVLSTNSKKTIDTFLKKYKLDKNIIKVYANIGLLGKTRALEKLLKDAGLQVEQCIYVGDEIRDVEAAKKAGIKCVAVGWGYNHPDSLKIALPDLLITKPAQLLEAINKIGRETVD